MAENTLLLIGLGIILLSVIATLVVTAGAWRKVRNTSYELGQRYSRWEDELERARMERLEVHQEAQRFKEQLEEQRPEKLTWELQRTTKELERLRNEHSENLRRAGLQEQEWVYRNEQQEQQRLHLEQERQNLMEELERWRVRYTEAQERAERSEQERSEAQQKVEELAQLRGRLLTEIQEIEGATPLSRLPDLQPAPLENQARSSNNRR